jgi:hypothetical protein
LVPFFFAAVLILVIFFAPDGMAGIVERLRNVVIKRARGA